MNTKKQTYCIDWENVGMVTFQVDIEKAKSCLNDLNHLFDKTGIEIDLIEEFPLLEIALKKIALELLKQFLFTGIKPAWLYLLEAKAGIAIANIDTSFVSFDDLYIHKIEAHHDY